MLVIESELPNPGEEYLRLRDAVGHIGVGVDLVVFTTHDFERRRQVRSTLPCLVGRARKAGCCMTPPREEAERLLAIAGRDARAFRVLAASPEVDPAVALFHARQAVEKSLKAVLSLHNVEFRRTHELLLLATLLDDSGLDVPIDKEILRLLVP